MNPLFKNETPIKLQPELRHVLAHICMAIDSLSEGKPLDAQDNIASIQSIIGLDDKTDWEEYYKKELLKWDKKLKNIKIKKKKKQKKQTKK